MNALTAIAPEPLHGLLADERRSPPVGRLDELPGGGPWREGVGGQAREAFERLRASGAEWRRGCGGGEKQDEHAGSHGPS
jgi:hypothetical protein